MALAEPRNPSSLLPYRVTKAEEAIDSLREHKASRLDVDMIRADIKELREAIRNWCIAIMGSVAVVIAGFVAIIHPHVS